MADSEVLPNARRDIAQTCQDFSGLIVRLIGSTVFEKTEKGFVFMNEALERQVEV